MTLQKVNKHAKRCLTELTAQNWLIKFKTSIKVKRHLFLLVKHEICTKRCLTVVAIDTNPSFS